MICATNYTKQKASRFYKFVIFPHMGTEGQTDTSSMVKSKQFMVMMMILMEVCNNDNDNDN